MTELHPPLPADFVAQAQMACKHYGKPERLGDLPLASIALRAALTKNLRHQTLARIDAARRKANH